MLDHYLYMLQANNLFITSICDLQHAGCLVLHVKDKLSSMMFRKETSTYINICNLQTSYANQEPWLVLGGFPVSMLAKKPNKQNNNKIRSQ